MSGYMGQYEGVKCYRVKTYEYDKNEKNYIFVDDYGKMFYKGEWVGRVYLPTMEVLEFDWAGCKKNVKVPVPACVAETSTAKEGETLCGADEFFARVALAIEETLSSIGSFDLGSE